MTSSAESPSGKHGEEASARDVDAHDEGWVQQSLFAPSVVETHLRIAWASESDHVQWQLEVFDPVTKELLAMSSVPHRSVYTAVQALDAALADLRGKALAVMNPDPF